MNGIRIGELAGRTGCPNDTIRSNESQGLPRRPERSRGNFRLYAEGDVDRLQLHPPLPFARHELAEVGTLLRTQDYPDHDCNEVMSSTRGRPV